MKALFYGLLAINLVVAGYAWFKTAPTNPDAGLLGKQSNADKIHMISARPMVAPQAKVPCLEWGPFSAAELKAAQAAIETMQLGERVTTREVSVVAPFWVYIPPMNTKLEVDRKVIELERLGIRDYYAVEGQSTIKNAISLGIFKTQAAADSYLEMLKARGVRSARTGSRDHHVQQTLIVVREPDVGLTAKLAELRVQFPGSELKASRCAA
ncbi:MAG: hypothetical protein ABI612_05690 [Betaproteobacteria bacterium]